MSNKLFVYISKEQLANSCGTPCIYEELDSTKKEKRPYKTKVITENIINTVIWPYFSMHCAINLPKHDNNMSDTVNALHLLLLLCIVS